MIYNLLERLTAHVETSVVQCFKKTLVTTELTAVATEGGCEIITVVLYITQLILCSYDLKCLCLFTFLSAANGAT